MSRTTIKIMSIEPIGVDLYELRVMDPAGNVQEPARGDYDTCMAVANEIRASKNGKFYLHNEREPVFQGEWYVDGVNVTDKVNPYIDRWNDAYFEEPESIDAVWQELTANPDPFAIIAVTWIGYQPN